MFSSLYVRGIQVEIPPEHANRYPYSIPAIAKLGNLTLHQPVTFLIGENGMGKSTLLEALALCCHFNPEGGSRNFSFSSHDSHSCLYQGMTVSWGIRRPKDGFFLRAESFYNVASEIERLDDGLGDFVAQYGDASYHCQSHGESFFSLVSHRFRGEGLYLLDEPEAALSPLRQMALLRVFHQLVEEKSQLIIATHSPILLAYPQAEIFHLSPQGIQPISYQECEPYRLTKEFLNAPEKMVDQLLRDSL